jgi:hypothetical protein
MQQLLRREVEKRSKLDAPVGMLSKSGVATMVVGVAGREIQQVA